MYRLQLVAHQVMARHPRVLCGALDQPVQRQPLVDLVAHLSVVHRRTHAFGSGVGRVLGQSGLNGSSSRRGWGGGVCGAGAGSTCGSSGGATGSVWGILSPLCNSPGKRPTERRRDAELEGPGTNPRSIAAGLAE